MNKWATIAGVILIAGFCGLGFVELSNSHIPYVTKVSAVKATSDKSLQFMGAIVQETVKFDIDNQELRFQLRDEKGDRLAVRYGGVKPANFDTAEKAVVVGKYETPDFRAESVLTSCPSKYKGK